MKNLHCCTGEVILPNMLVYLGILIICTVFVCMQKTVSLRGRVCGLVYVTMNVNIMYISKLMLVKFLG